jgi:hypothetical protein
MNGRPLARACAMGALSALAALAGTLAAFGADSGARYLQLPSPQLLDLPHQDWEGDQQPHTFSVLEMNRGGFRYWAWYGLNNGRGVGLARSNDLVRWTKYEHNPLWLNARWPSVLSGTDPAHSELLTFAITRDYDTPSSRIVLATSSDGLKLTEVKDLVAPVNDERNQNPNLFRDPASGRYFLTWYRGNDTDYFDIVSRNAATVDALDRAPDELLLHSTTTIAAPNLLYLPHGSSGGKPVYFLATEVYPNRYDDANRGEWQVKVFSSDKPNGHFEPVAGNPVETGERACLFQHVFDQTFYGYQCRLDHKTELWQMEVVVAPLPK